LQLKAQFEIGFSYYSFKRCYHRCLFQHVFDIGSLHSPTAEQALSFLSWSSSGRALSAVCMSEPRGANGQISLSFTEADIIPLGTPASASPNDTAPSTAMQRRNLKLEARV
jgi:hypothetical protein